MYNGNKPLFLLEMEVSGLSCVSCIHQITRSTILGIEDWNDEYKNQILSARGSTLPVGNAQALTKQSAWDRPLIELDKAEVWSAYTDPCSRARLVAVSSPHSGDWLLSMPISSCGLCLENEDFRVAIGLRLGLKLCAPHQCDVE